MSKQKLKNPDFDDDRVIWDDHYDGEYQPVDYSQQFDEQWSLFLDKVQGYHNHTGVETSNEYIDDRIYELTGIPEYCSAGNESVQTDQDRDIGGRLYLEPKFHIDFFKGKHCLDIGCGAGRWTKTLLTLGASVKSVDVSENALRSTQRFNPDTEKLDIFDIPSRKDLHNAFDFTLCWGVIMCTHNPLKAFEHVAKTVAPGGMLYIMVYAPTYHASDSVRQERKKFHQQCKTTQEKIDYVYEIAEDPRNAINYLDMLNTFYNWTITEETIHHWLAQSGFKEITTLNKHEPHNCAWHITATRPL